ncbi:effector-associated domain EAD1-containing protein [cf. Phormidesmis sp. LEGE 11477]|uniref:VMAP-C domain-containing protein n=1 Tax=cf. Phormidesmis sp. LEGE 11477 TaxID=1828680 RepID=UPI00187F2DD2|nr:effector-associated domain EAD1-containing protein [cf. Phormidesmis sp. LEGE 11477]MBE9062379.1 hypothetical protein [cf. Phormidesmis sp. LEGE 11477]
MSLTDDQVFDLKLDLVDALLKAFSSEGDLEFVVKRSLRTGLNGIIQNAESFGVTVDKVVESAAANGKLLDLTVGSALRKPGCSELKRFISQNLENLLIVNPNELLNEAMITSLVSVLRPFAQMQDFAEQVLSATRETIGDLETKAPKLREQLRHREFSGSVKLLVLFELYLFKLSRNYDGCSPIVLFVENLAQLTSGSIPASLKQWLDDLPPALRPPQLSEQSLEPPLERPLDAFLKNPQASFLVVVEAFETAECGVSGYVVSRMGSDDPNPEFESVALEMCSVDDSTGESSCSSQGTFEQIKEAFPEWLDKAMEAIKSRGLLLQKKYHLQACPSFDITVEFWLPFDYLSAATETWNIYDLLANRKTKGRVVGKQYKVLVRSYDRLKVPEAFLKLNEIWQKIQSDSPSEGLVASDIQLPYCLDCWSQAEVESVQVKKAVPGLSMVYPICDSQYLQQREKLFAWMLNNGVPLLLWSRHKDLSKARQDALAQEMEDWLASADVAQIEQLFETILQARKRPEGSLLALWCDEPRSIAELTNIRGNKRRRLRA